MQPKKKRSLKEGADMIWKDDMLGSYTGTCDDEDSERPVQDADDL